MSTAENSIAAERGWTQPSPSASTRPHKPQRRLKPEAIAKLSTRRGQAALEDLYQKPVQELSPEELATMRAAFFRG